MTASAVEALSIFSRSLMSFSFYHRPLKFLSLEEIFEVLQVPAVQDHRPDAVPLRETGGHGVDRRVHARRPLFRYHPAVLPPGKLRDRASTLHLVRVRAIPELSWRKYRRM